jgi:hypothetical protein
MSKRCAIIQPGKLGDIIICAPIAQYYADKGYEVYWPVFNEFYNTVKRFDYVTPVNLGVSLGNSYYGNQRMSFFKGGKTIEEIIKREPNAAKPVEMFRKIDEFIETNDLERVDPCFSFIGHNNVHNNNMTTEFINTGRNWIDLKYHLVDVPLEERWNLNFSRDQEAENKLEELIGKFLTAKNYKEYSVVHSYKSNILPKISPKNPIEFMKIMDFQIFDWLPVLEKSSEIYCVDSSLANFIEVVPSLRENKKFYLGSEELHYHRYMRNILKNNWTNLSKR